MVDRLLIERVFDAPLEKVWKMWSEAEMYKKWWGPKIFTAPVIEIDFRVGGKFLGCMRGSPTSGAPEQDFWSTGIYKEIMLPDTTDGAKRAKIVVTDSFADEKGNVVPSSHYGMEGMPLEMLITVEFEEKDGKTHMTLTHDGMPEGENMKLANQGWNESLDKMAYALKS